MNTKNIYERKLVVFLDLLGFGDIILKAGDNPERILRIRDFLQATKSLIERIYQLDKYGLKIKSGSFRHYFFSDTVIMTCPYTSYEYLLALFVWVMSYQIELLIKEGVFIRGAIVYDDVFEEKDIIFGPALLNAYNIERKDAVWPRVVVTQSVIDEAFERSHDNIINHLAKDKINKLKFLDYLYFLPVRIGMNENYEKLGVYLCSHKIKICQAIEMIKNDRLRGVTKKKDILNKYYSLISYHNHSIDEITNNIDSLINDPAWIGFFKNNIPSIDSFILKDDIKSQKIKDQIIGL